MRNSFSRKDSCLRHNITTHSADGPPKVIYHRELDELMKEILEAAQEGGDLSSELIAKINTVIQSYGPPSFSGKSRSTPLSGTSILTSL